MFILIVFVLFCNAMGFYVSYLGNLSLTSSRFYNFMDSDTLRFLWYTVGIIGTGIGSILYDRHLKKSSQKYDEEQKRRRDKEYIDTYGALPSEINERIPQSENLKKLVELILRLPYLPYQIHIDRDKIFWFVRDENGLEKSETRFFSNYGIAPVPYESVGTLAHALACDTRIREKYDYTHDNSDWASPGFVHMLTLKNEYKMKDLNRW